MEPLPPAPGPGPAPPLPGTTSDHSTFGTARSTLTGLLVRSVPSLASFPARSLHTTRMWNSYPSPVGADQLNWPSLLIQSGVIGFQVFSVPCAEQYSSLIGTGAMFASVAFHRMSTTAPRSPFG